MAEKLLTGFKPRTTAKLCPDVGQPPLATAKVAADGSVRFEDLDAGQYVVEGKSGAGHSCEAHFEVSDE